MSLTHLFLGNVRKCLHLAVLDVMIALYMMKKICVVEKIVHFMG